MIGILFARMVGMKRVALLAVGLVGLAGIVALLASSAPAIAAPLVNVPMLEERSSLDRDRSYTINPDGIPENGLPAADASAATAIPDAAEEDEPPLLVGPGSLDNFDIPIVFNEAVQYFIQFFTVEKRKVFTNWLRRSERYVPLIRDILREHGLPEDLVYLAMIESGFNTRAYSPMKACGPWQFIYETGERYGLKVTHWVDERRDPRKSTVAAARYLRDLFKQFGDWYLAAAGYNAGEKRVERAIARHETTDFWKLSKYNTLPRETREYIPQLIAAAIIAKEPERYGFTGIDYESPIEFVEEQVPGGVSVEAVARAASVDLTVVRSLNPELLTGITPPDAKQYAIKLPKGIEQEEFRENLAEAVQGERKIRGFATYVVKKKDSLPRIMKRYGVSYADLALVNYCDRELKAKPGSTVYIPSFYKQAGARPEAKVLLARALKKEAPSSGADEARKAPAEEQKRAAQPEKRVAKTYHIVKKGEKLADISEKYGVDVATLRQINGLKKGRVRPNMRIELVSEKKVQTKQGGAFHTVKKGENLSDISEKYGVNLVTLKRVNKLRSDRILAGMRLRLPDKKG